LVGSIFHMTRKIVSEMTYNVSMGTLNPTIPYLRAYPGEAKMCLGVRRSVGDSHPSCSFCFPFPQIQLGCLGALGYPAEIEFNWFKVKNLASGENNFSDVHEELYWLPLFLSKHFPLFFLEHLLQRLYSVDAPGCCYCSLESGSHEITFPIDYAWNSHLILLASAFRYVTNWLNAKLRLHPSLGIITGCTIMPGMYRDQICGMTETRILWISSM